MNVAKQECGCEVTPGEIALCVWHFMAQACTVCGERIGKNGHLGRDSDPVCDGCLEGVKIPEASDEGA